MLGARLQLETDMVWLTSKSQQKTHKPLKTGNTERLKSVLWETIQEDRRREVLLMQGAGHFSGDCIGARRRCGDWGRGFPSGSWPGRRWPGSHFPVSTVSLEVSRAGFHPSPDFGRLRWGDLFENLYKGMKLLCDCSSKQSMVFIEYILDESTLMDRRHVNCNWKRKYLMIYWHGDCPNSLSLKGLCKKYFFLVILIHICIYTLYQQTYNPKLILLVKLWVF